MALAHPILFCLPRLSPKQIMVPAKLESQPPSLRSTCRFLGAVSSTTTQFSISHHPKDERPSVNYQPSIWSYDFLQSLNNDRADIIYKERAAKLEEELRCGMNDENADPLNLLQLIDDIQRLGLEHRFEMDINRALAKFVSGVATENTIGLHAVALRFRLLRQYGYDISQDVFKGFMDGKGNFKECLCEDVKAMLSLYEASLLRFEGEDVMDEALVFTRMHLKGISEEEKDLTQQVTRALDLPLHRKLLRLETRRYIEDYGERDNAKLNLLELAKVDFNMVQSTLQEDLKEMSRWWMDMGMASKLNFARDRLTECFFWTVGVVSQPQFRHLASFVTTIDDIYDVHGTLDELESFTDAVQRWDLGAVENLPDYMELCFLALYNSINEMAYETLRDQGQNILPYLRKAWADLCKAFLKEANWAHSKHIPTFQEYLENAWLPVSGHLCLVHTYFLQRANITIEALHSLEHYHDVIRWPSIIFRLCNDLGTAKDELERGKSVNAIICYMNETGCSEAMARQHISDLIEDYWQKLNKCYVDGSPFSKHYIETLNKSIKRIYKIMKIYLNVLFLFL
ncbi:hypothetical protein GOBAR_AA03177 [Gossypium barbadense]|uniref:(+)-delta-cadinene synthase n=1 Tax=Gossypium barbadense TaxID=3634 RepID=A0A2P5YP66_GOSBA|nr:hypothetical protein GOBAR_AA03177 [Gossypium barbadense]